jgi:hypothetical protein
METRYSLSVEKMETGLQPLHYILDRNSGSNGARDSREAMETRYSFSLEVENRLQTTDILHTRLAWGGHTA